ncbi:MAG: hypothetical protein E4H20_04365 [Spirochaetales bacterium]|nr:MAG: hypothetical protein E4H20_04365 [Spirochaetales bacterium]
MHMFEFLFIVLVAFLSVTCLLPGRIDSSPRRFLSTRGLAGLAVIAAIGLRAAELNTWRSDAATIMTVVYCFFFFVLRPRPPKTDSPFRVPIPPESENKATVRRILGGLGLAASLVSLALLFVFSGS